MSKYEPLGEFLKNQRTDRVPMSFAEIERVTRTKLPASAKYRAWWSNNSFNSVMTKIWLDAGFESEQVDMAGRKLVFRRVRAASDIKPMADRISGREAIHPLAGLLKDVTRVQPGLDLTKPADLEWGTK